MPLVRKAKIFATAPIGGRMSAKIIVLLELEACWLQPRDHCFAALSSGNDAPFLFVHLYVFWRMQELVEATARIVCGAHVVEDHVGFDRTAAQPYHVPVEALQRSIGIGVLGRSDPIHPAIMRFVMSHSSVAAVVAVRLSGAIHKQCVVCAGLHTPLLAMRIAGGCEIT